MRYLFGAFILLAGVMVAPAFAHAQMQTLSVTVSFRERIALPPDAELELRLLEAGNADAQAGAVAARRFAMTAVPMTVSLVYDPRAVRDGSGFAVVASIRSPDGRRLFAAAETLEGSAPAAADILLRSVPAADEADAVPRRIAGVAWTVTEVFGNAWTDGDPATLVIDDAMSVSVFGGCNRFRGQARRYGRGLVFDETMAGTMMACPDGVEARERRFLAALLQVSDYVRYGGGLVMMDADGRAVLHFVETPE